MAKKNTTIEDLSQKIDRFAKSMDKRFDLAGKKIEDEIGGLAAMTAREFGKVHQKADKTLKQVENLRKEHLIHDFKMTEMVHKADYYQLEERVGKIEVKIGLGKD